MRSSRPTPPLRYGSSPSQHTRPMRYCFIVVMSMVTNKATAVLSTVEVIQDETAVHDIAFMGKKKNIALYRPCHPVPLCSALVDNNQGTIAALESLHNEPLTRSGETSKAFQIFLQQHTSISDVIVVCAGGLARDQPLSGKLLVTMWSSSHGPVDVSNATGDSRAWSKKMESTITVTNQPVTKVAFHFEDMASAITIEWDSQDEDRTSDASLYISEVLVTTSNVSEEELSMTAGEIPPVMEGGDIMRIKSAWAKLNRQNGSELGVENDEANGTYLTSDSTSEEHHSGLVLNSSRSKRATGAMLYKQRPRTTMQPKFRSHADTTLAPAGMDSGRFQHPEFMKVWDNAHADWKQVEDAKTPTSPTLASLGLQTYIPVILAAVLIGAVILVHAKIVDCLCYRRKYQLLSLDDPEAALPGSNLSRPDLRREFGRQSFETSRCARRLRFLHRTPPTTESEPEEESEPLIPADAPEQETLEPRPVLLGVSGSSSSTAPAPAEQVNSRRVVLLYASPLCYRGQGNRPLPLPQIPFEKEWSVMLRAHDEAKSALRMSDSETVKRRPAACLEAQPLTAASLRRLVAPSPEPTRSGSAAVLHLSAHGVKDMLVAEDGKTTAHFISSDVLRSMLADNAAPAKLVVLNACSLRLLGDQFVNGGVPHVICSSAELRDSASHVFLCAMYSSLFQGGTVAHAFRAAIVALRSDPEESTRSAADYFYLLPEQAAHNEVIFKPEIVAMPRSLRPTLAPSLHAGVPPAPASLDRDSSGGSGASGEKSTSIGSPFLSSDVTESSTDGPDESCYSEGHVDTSSNSGSHGSGRKDTSSDSEDSNGSATEKTRLLFASSSTSAGSILPVAAARRPRASGAPARGSASATSVPRNRPGRNNITCKRRLSLRRSLPSCALAQSEASLSPFGRAVPPLPEDFVGRSLDVWEVLQYLCDRRAVVVCGAPGTTHGIGKSALLDAVHRSFSLQMGGVCIPVHLRALCDADVASVASTWEWMVKVKAKVQSTFDEYLDIGRQAIGIEREDVASTFAQRSSIMGGVCNGSAQALRRRITVRNSNGKPVPRGFHSLSDPVASRPVLEELAAVMSAFAEYCEERNRALPTSAASSRRPSGVRILLLLDECDHLIQQRHFQDAIAEVLRKCPAYGVVLSTQQHMVETGGGWFKVVHKQVAGLSPRDAAQFFLRRAHRPLYWDEIPPVSGDGNAGEEASATATCETRVTRQQVVKTKENEAELLCRVAAHPVIAAQEGNPRRLLEIASRVRDSLDNLSDLAVVR